MSTASQDDQRLRRLRQLDGAFPSDLLGPLDWVALPSVAVLAIVDEIRESSWPWAVAFLLLGCFGLWWWGYMVWLQRDHRYVISNGRIASVGRRTLWTLDLGQVTRIREYRTGSLTIWGLRSPQGERRLVLSRSLREQLGA